VTSVATDIRCEHCDGSGEIPFADCPIHPWSDGACRCPSAFVEYERCPDCDGTGVAGCEASMALPLDDCHERAEDVREEPSGGLILHYRLCRGHAKAWDREQRGRAA
jgi:hypothetical protein